MSGWTRNSMFPIVLCMMGAIICIVNAFNGLLRREVDSGWSFFSANVVRVTGHEAVVVGSRWLASAIALSLITALLVWLEKRD